MKELHYLEQVEQRLREQGLLAHSVPAEADLALAFCLEKAEPWGRLLIAMAGPEVAAEEATRFALAQAATGYVRQVRAGSEEPVYMILIFPFFVSVPEQVSNSVRSLKAGEPEAGWGVIPWTADLEIELIDRHSGFPRVDDRLARIITEVPRGRVEQVWRKASAPKIGRRSAIFGNLGYVPTTRIILSLTIGYYIATLVASGAGFALLRGLDGMELIRWGGNWDRLTLGESQHWRLLTYMLLHGGLLHLGFNMWALWNLGRYAELVFGSARMLFVYLFAGVTAGMASVMLRPGPVLSVGASGAILGLLGALIYFGRTAPGRRVDTRQLWTNALVILVYGLLIPVIDNYAHVGGFVGGYAAAFLVGAAGERTSWRSWAIGGASLLLIIILSGLVPLPSLPLFRS